MRVGTDSLTFDYDAFGRLVRRKTNGVVDRHWVYIGNQIYAELSGTLTKRMQYNYYQGIDRPHSINNGKDLFLQDEVGNVLGQVNADLKTVTQRVSYDPWGKPTYSGEYDWKQVVMERLDA